MARRKGNGVARPRTAAISSLTELIDRQRNADRSLVESAFLASEQSRGMVLARLLVEHAIEMKCKTLKLEVAEHLVVVSPKPAIAPS